MSDIADNPEALAAFVRHLGGEPIAHQRFRFVLPLAETKRVVPEINRLGLSCNKVDERNGTDADGKACSIAATIEISRKPEKTAYDEERSLMSAIIR
jgi:hypothetical protein